MKKLILILMLLTSSSFAEAKQFGLGAILFGPTGLSTNYYFNRTTSLDTAWSWSLNDDDQTLYIHSTYLFHKPKLLKLGTLPAIDFHYGGGARLIVWDDRPGKHDKHDDETAIGVRGAVGLNYLFKPAIQVFGELSLTMDLIPETDADIDLGIGARFYF